MLVIDLTSLKFTELIPELFPKIVYVLIENNLSIFLQPQEILYDWDEETQGLLLSAFYYGYVITHLPGGLLAEKFGGKWTLGLSLLCTSLSTLFTPFVVRQWGAIGLFCMRVFSGIGEVQIFLTFSLPKMFL